MVAPVSNVLDRMLTPVADCFTYDSAKRLIDLQIDSDTQSRIDELARKADEGTLNDAERSEYADFVEAIDLIGILQSKARHLVLDRANG